MPLRPHIRGAPWRCSTLPSLVVGRSRALGGVVLQASGADAHTGTALAAAAAAVIIHRPLQGSMFMVTGVASGPGENSSCIAWDSHDVLVDERIHIDMRMLSCIL